MLLDQELLNTLTAQAKANPRLRQNYDLRNSGNDNSQRILNASKAGRLSWSARMERGNRLQKTKYWNYNYPIIIH